MKSRKFISRTVPWRARDMTKSMLHTIESCVILFRTGPFFYFCFKHAHCHWFYWCNILNKKIIIWLLTRFFSTKEFGWSCYHSFLCITTLLRKHGFRYMHKGWFHGWISANHENSMIFPWFSMFQLSYPGAFQDYWWSWESS